MNHDRRKPSAHTGPVRPGRDRTSFSQVPRPTRSALQKHARLLAWLGAIWAVPNGGLAQIDEVAVAPADGTCWGAYPTIVCTGGPCAGTLGNDVILGSPLADDIRGRAGDDIICGGGGDDIIRGGAGADHLFGQAGADTIYGGLGDDHLHGNDGPDELHGGPGDDLIYGGLGMDTIHGGSGADAISGGRRADAIWGEDGDDEIYGDRGDDFLDGGDGMDLLVGGRGDDLLEGRAGADQLFGNLGADVLYGQDGDDALEGGGGPDTLYGGAGNDQLDGAAGDDVIYGEQGNDVLFGDAGDDLCDGGAGTDTEVGETCEDKVSVEFPPGDGRDKGSQLGARCDYWSQNCNAGLKCAPAPDGTFTCQPLPDNPDQVGDGCSALRQGDSCNVDGVCIDGVCIALCGGSPAAPTCPDNDQVCHLYDDGPALCEDVCDPLLSTPCPEGYRCAAEQGSLELFTCVHVDDGEGFPLPDGGACVTMSQCQGGLACLSAGALQYDYCNSNRTLSCCAPLCDLSDADPNAACSSPHVCTPFYGDNPPPGYAHVGVCTL